MKTLKSCLLLLWGIQLKFKVMDATKTVFSDTFCLTFCFPLQYETIKMVVL